MDQPPLREGGVVGLWVPHMGGETFYEADMPACCQRGARGAEETFECISCGAVWQAPLPVEPEACAFAERPEQERGAA